MAYQIGPECIGCTSCARLCPVFAIAGERGTLHSVNKVRCVDCGVCGRVCPKGAISGPDGVTCAAIPRKQWPKPTIVLARCSACSMCVSICTAGALRIARPKFQGDIHVAVELFAQEKCVGCALCQRECPLGAISMGEGG